MCFYVKFTFSAKMCHVDKLFFSNITYKEGWVYQKRSELDFRCKWGRKGENRYPNWHYLYMSEKSTRHKALIVKEACRLKMTIIFSCKQ